MTMNGSHPTNYLETLKKKKIAVVGLGRSGFATARFLLKNNISLFISDSRQDIDRHALEFIERNKIDHEIGENSDKILDSQLILISPGVPRDLPVIKKALNDGIDVINDIELLYRVLPQKKIVAVTGSNGKTTATALIGEIFNSYCSTWVGGNIGKPALSIFEDADCRELDFIVLELSNFQLESLTTFKPFISILLNITPDHLDRYNGFYEYAHTKYRIFRNQDKNDFLIVNRDDKHLKNIHPASAVKGYSLTKSENCYFDGTSIYYNGRKLLRKDELQLKGNHNVQNVMASIIAAKIANIPEDKIIQAVRAFKGIEHRLEFVGESNGVKYYNDSKATNPDSAAAALRSFNGSIIWLAGGRDKNTPLDLLKREVVRKVKYGLFFGEARDKFYDYFSDSVKCSRTATLKEALRFAGKIASEGDTILLSPACASFDAYNSYKERGTQFKNIVTKLLTNHELV